MCSFNCYILYDYFHQKLSVDYMAFFDITKTNYFYNLTDDNLAYFIENRESKAYFHNKARFVWGELVHMDY